MHTELHMISIIMILQYQFHIRTGEHVRNHVNESDFIHRLQRKPLVSDPDMHHGTCRDACWDRLPAVTGKTLPAFQVHAQPVILRIWQDAHGQV